MQVLRGHETVLMDDEAVRARCSTAERVVIDVGTGDARWAYRTAKANPSWLVIGIDPARDRMVEMAHRSSRKPAKGGVDNLWLVPTDVENAPAALSGGADEIQVLLPWGSLLRGVVLGEPSVLGALAQLGRPRADTSIVVGADIWEDPVPNDIRSLPGVDPSYVHNTLTTRYAAVGITITEVNELSEEQWRAIPSSWARRLAHGRLRPRFIQILGSVTRGDHRSHGSSTTSR